MGHEHLVDCATFEGHCAGNGLDISRCVPDANDCTIATPERCIGNSLQACVNGKVESIDCTSIGFRTCVTTPAIIGHMEIETAVPVTAALVVLAVGSWLTSQSALATVLADWRDVPTPTNGWSGGPRPPASRTLLA